MPTGAKLISALYFLFLGYVGAHIVHSIFEAEVGYDLDFGRFKEIAAVICCLTGWRMMGNRVEEGYNLAIMGGILTAVTMVFWNLVLWAAVEMIGESMKLKYNGAMQAIKDAIRIAIEYSQTIATVEFIGTMVVGAVIGGILAEWTSSRFR